MRYSDAQPKAAWCMHRDCHGLESWLIGILWDMLVYACWLDLLGRAWTQRPPSRHHMSWDAGHYRHATDRIPFLRV